MNTMSLYQDNHGGGLPIIGSKGNYLHRINWTCKQTVLYKESLETFQERVWSYIRGMFYMCRICHEYFMRYFLRLRHFWGGPPRHTWQSWQTSVTEKVSLIPTGASGLSSLLLSWSLLGSTEKASLCHAHRDLLDKTTVPQPSWPSTVGVGSFLLKSNIFQKEVI